MHLFYRPLSCAVINSPAWEVALMLSSRVLCIFTFHLTKFPGVCVFVLPLPVCFHSSLPMKKNHPIIMIGPGTGIAPFRGFLQEREYLMGQDKVLGEALLLFGCQKESQHYLYREELEEYVEKGVLNHLFTAFSRDQDEKRYVQHLIAENSALLYNLIVEKHGFIYICGDGKHMAPDVRAALCTMYRQEGAKTEAQAKDWLDQLEMRRHLMQDVW
eukprot:m.37711 g.37711  ORF g.37711 m.37711 type:complete len:215 (+) comp10122_c0_seq2:155-799(+)